MEYMTVGAEFNGTDAKKAKIDKAIAGLTWQNIADVKTLPMMPGLAIKALITEFGIPKVGRIAYDGVLTQKPAKGEGGCYSFYGIEAQYKNGLMQLFFLDTGCEVVPLAAQKVGE